MNPLVLLVFALLFVTPAWTQSTPAWAQPAPARPQQRPPAAESRPAPKSDPRADPKAVLRAMEDAFSAVADRVTPAVVHVSTVQKKGAAGALAGKPERFRKVFGDGFSERYFRRRPREQARGIGLGLR